MNGPNSKVYNFVKQAVDMNKQRCWCNGNIRHFQAVNVLPWVRFPYSVSTACFIFVFLVTDIGHHLFALQAHVSLLPGMAASQGSCTLLECAMAVTWSTTSPGPVVPWRHDTRCVSTESRLQCPKSELSATMTVLEVEVEQLVVWLDPQNTGLQPHR